MAEGLKAYQLAEQRNPDPDMLIVISNPDGNGDSYKTPIGDIAITPIVEELIIDRMRGTNYSSNYNAGSSTNPWYIQQDQIPFDVIDIAAAGMHLYRIYADENNASLHLAALDVIQENDPQARVLLNRFITYNSDYSVATGASNRTAAIAKFTGMVTNLKDHPIVIGFIFGNENNYNLGSTPPADYYTMAEAAIAAAKVIAPDKLYTVAVGEIATVRDYGEANTPSVDFWSANIYRGTAVNNLERDMKIASSKPWALTEFGKERVSNSTAEQLQQAVANNAMIAQLESMWPTVRAWMHFKFTDTQVAPPEDEVYGITAPREEDSFGSRTKYTSYTAMSSLLNAYGYGGAGVNTMYTDLMLGGYKIIGLNTGIFGSATNGTMSLFAADSINGGAYIKATGKTYGSSPGKGTVEVIVGQDTTGGLTSKFKVTSTNFSGSFTDRMILEGSTGILTLYRGLVVNEDGADSDVRIEGDTDTNLMFLDASSDRVGIGTATPSSKLHVAGVTTIGDGASNASMALVLNSERAWRFKAGSTGATTTLILQADTDGKHMQMQTQAGGALFDILNNNSVTASLFQIFMPVVMNESGTDTDTRIEGDTDTNLLFVDASTDRVGIGTNTPGYKLHVNGALNLSAGFAFTINGVIATANMKFPNPVSNGGTKQFGVPGERFNTVSTGGLTANEVKYIFIQVAHAITITAHQFEVTTGPASDGNVRIGLYLASSTGQPSGAPIYDSGSIAVATAFTGLKTTTGLSVSVPAGTYLIAINTDQAMTLRTLIAPTPILASGMGANSLTQRVTAAQTYGAFPTPGDNWTTQSNTTGGQQHNVEFQWSYQA